MKNILALTLFALFLPGFAQTTSPAPAGINFEHNLAWSDLMAKARKEKKLVMVDAYTTWCGPCKWMSKNIFPLQDVGEFYNKNFINAKIDMEKGEGIEIAKKYDVKNYPIFLFIDGNGKMVHRVCGSREAAQFIQAGKDALDPASSLSALQSTFQSANSSPEAAINFFNAASDACMDVESDVMKFLNSQKAEALTEKGNYNLIINFINDYKNPAFQYLIAHYTDFVALYTKAEVDHKILTVFTAAVKKALRAKDEAALAEVQRSYRNEAKEQAGYLDAMTDVAKAKSSNDTSAYFKAVIIFTDNYLMSEPQQLNSYAWDFYEKTNNTAHLLRAEAWAKRSTELQPAYYNYDTYAAVLFKLGKYTEAKSNASKAIELGKKENADVKETEDLLEKIKLRS